MSKPVIVEKPKEDLAEEARRKYLETLTLESQAKIDYVAMMTDVEIPTEEDKEDDL